MFDIVAFDEHVGATDGVRDDKKQPVGLVELGDFGLEAKVVEDIACLRGKALDVAGQVGGDFVRLALELPEVEPARVMERHLGNAIENWFDVANLAPFEALFLGQHFFFGRFQHAIEATQHGERQNNLAILGGLVRPTEQVRNAPDKTDLFAEVVQGRSPNCLSMSRCKGSAWLHATFVGRTKSRGKQLFSDSFQFRPFEEPVIVDCVSVFRELAISAPITNRIGGNAKKLGSLMHQQIVVGSRLHFGVLPELHGKDYNHDATLPKVSKNEKYPASAICRLLARNGVRGLPNPT